MSYYYDNDLNNTILNRHSNYLNRSSSLPAISRYPIAYDPYYSINPNYNSIYTNSYALPILNYSQQTKLLGDELDYRNQIKDETLDQKAKFLGYRGLPDIDYDCFRNSWQDFHRRRQKEKNRKRLINIIRGDNYYDTKSDNDIFRWLDNSMPSKIEDKIKIKQYLPLRKELAKLMIEASNRIQRKVDSNTYLVNQNIYYLEKDYNNLKKLIEKKMDRLEKKQKKDFAILNKYLKEKDLRYWNRSMDNLYKFYNDKDKNQEYFKMAEKMKLFNKDKKKENNEKLKYDPSFFNYNFYNNGNDNYLPSYFKKGKQDDDAFISGNELRNIYKEKRKERVKDILNMK